MIVRETCKVLWQILQPIEMAEPTTNDWLDIANGYFEKTQFPNTVGAVSYFIHFLVLLNIGKQFKCKPVKLKVLVCIYDLFFLN